MWSFSVTFSLLPHLVSLTNLLVVLLLTNSLLHSFLSPWNKGSRYILDGMFALSFEPLLFTHNMSHITSMFLACCSLYFSAEQKGTANLNSWKALSTRYQWFICVAGENEANKTWTNHQLGKCTKWRATCAKKTSCHLLQPPLSPPRMHYLAMQQSLFWQFSFATKNVPSLTRYLVI